MDRKIPERVWGEPCSDIFRLLVVDVELLSNQLDNSVSILSEVSNHSEAR
jgi:hypothetical protein